VVPSQKFVNIIIRNSRNIQLYQVSRILLATSSGLMGVSCLQDPLFSSWSLRCVKSIHTLITHEFVQNSENLRTSKNLEVFPKNRIENFIDSNYTHYTQKIANSNTAQEWTNRTVAEHTCSKIQIFCYTKTQWVQ